MTFQFYVDSADDEQVTALLEDRLVRGVTTNPEILARAGVQLRDLERLVPRWVDLGAERVFLQAWGASGTQMLACAHRLRALSPQVVVKVPATQTGFPVAARLAAQGVEVLLTAVYGPAQDLMAAALGAHSIAPYLGRLDDAGRDGAEEIGEMVALLTGSVTMVLAASLRSPDRIVDLATRGVAAFTAQPAVLRAALADPTSDAAAAAFEEAAARL